MAKISPVSIKYIIHAKLDANGAVEKPDIIGAIFGQTEGLLGEELEMRELQKSGKIGRIEVNVDYGNGKTNGEIEVPSAMDKPETAIIAAALETIERVGPSDTKITIDDIEDVRGNKRDYILERAKKLMEKLGETKSELDEMTDEINTHVKVSKLQNYGTENLPSGDVSGDELIIVEGRADVVNLLKKGVKNVIAMNGTKLPETVIRLSREKGSVILFVDGDRGGNLIIKNVTSNAKIDFIAMAPEGKEVEELTSKEILQALRKKIPAREYQSEQRTRGVRSYEDEDRHSPERDERAENTHREKITSAEKEKIRSEVEDLVGTKGVLVFNRNLDVVSRLPLRRLTSLRLHEPPYVIAIDGAATKKIIEACEYFNCHNLIASNFVSSDTPVHLESM